MQGKPSFPLLFPPQFGRRGQYTGFSSPCLFLFLSSRLGLRRSFVDRGFLHIRVLSDSRQSDWQKPLADTSRILLAPLPELHQSALSLAVSFRKSNLQGTLASFFLLVRSCSILLTIMLLFFSHRRSLFVNSARRGLVLGDFFTALGAFHIFKTLVPSFAPCLRSFLLDASG